MPRLLYSIILHHAMSGISSNTHFCCVFWDWNRGSFIIQSTKEEAQRGPRRETSITADRNFLIDPWELYVCPFGYLKRALNDSSSPRLEEGCSSTNEAIPQKH